MTTRALQDRRLDVMKTHDDLVPYIACLKALHVDHGLTYTRIAELTGSAYEVVSRRLNGHQSPNREAVIVINVLLEIFNHRNPITPVMFPAASWLADLVAKVQAHD